ncbi:hypothetical protein LTR10_020677 [Elasticomyces elasticus]|uniref:Inhibitor of growth protein N-terminal histone-binding domain-containing protein n=1 Tax=Exophiala sideris TaxID=1016849 RepID=A0ABR0JHL9_9EURO|nr:hypothetical protein LTR10_020677 [Elasticomyces elasticus]KAK5033576.1 hypothetical protein LTS07_003881 [Exophiala sideris]KAK5041929.1 hypothetical protein LTR13_001734 [Exophiala sideris]KAK5064120.1 hypothetical protein LTR69_003889 [Exophiala sideris]KAK5185197.1 hypothetical protein LTR44_002185 [Eurotiomycetes sp. CCFEE 6388]
MDTNDSDRVWEKFFEQHDSIVSLLDSHASLLVEMRHHCADGTAARDLIQSRLLNAENLIATFKSSTESLREVTNREEVILKTSSDPSSRVPESLPHAPAEPTVDPSGLFSVDPNPSDINHLLQKKTTPKRKLDDFGSETIGANGGEQDGPSHKRPRSRDHAQPENDDSFVRGVEARVRAKEDRKKARSDKKRKRQSNEAMDDGGNGSRHKKQKSGAHKPLEIRHGRNNKRSKGESGNNEVQNERPTKKRKKSKSR